MAMHRLNMSFDGVLDTDVSKEMHMLEDYHSFRDKMRTGIDAASLYPMTSSELAYCREDVEAVKDTINYLYGKRQRTTFYMPGIKKVIFNDPATIVIWADGEKTVVKAHDEKFDPEKGMAMAIAKKALGNKGSYFNEFKKWLPKEEDTTPEPIAAGVKIEETLEGIRATGTLTEEGMMALCITKDSFDSSVTTAEAKYLANWCHRNDIYTIAGLKEYLTSHPYGTCDQAVYYRKIGKRRFEHLHKVAFGE